MERMVSRHGLPDGGRDALTRAPVMALFLVREVEVLLGSSVKDPKPNPTASS
jgi:hypothetical protein